MPKRRRNSLLRDFRRRSPRACQELWATTGLFIMSAALSNTSKRYCPRLHGTSARPNHLPGVLHKRSLYVYDCFDDNLNYLLINLRCLTACAVVISYNTPVVDCVAVILSVGGIGARRSVQRGFQLRMCISFLNLPHITGFCPFLLSFFTFLLT